MLSEGGTGSGDRLAWARSAARKPRHPRDRTPDPLAEIRREARRIADEERERFHASLAKALDAARNERDRLHGELVLERQRVTAARNELEKLVGEGIAKGQDADLLRAENERRGHEILRLQREIESLNAYINPFEENVMAGFWKALSRDISDFLDPLEEYLGDSFHRPEEEKAVPLSEEQVKAQAKALRLQAKRLYEAVKLLQEFGDNARAFALDYEQRKGK